MEILSIGEEVEQINDGEFDRKERWQHRRIDWPEHLKLLLHENSFQDDYGMSLNAWNKLRSIVRVHLERKWRYSRDLEPIFIEIIMGIGMRFLRGGKMNDIRRIYNVSKTEAYRCRNNFIAAILLSPELDIKFPTSA